MAFPMKHLSGKAIAARPTKPTRAMKSVECQAAKTQFGRIAAATLAASTIIAGAASALTYDEQQGLTYLQVKGSGMANTCPVLTSGSTDLKTLKASDYRIEMFCMEPTSFTVKDESRVKDGEPEFVQTRLLTRLTYTLDAMSGTFNLGGDGSVDFKEEDGIDYAATTLQLPGGDRVPFLFTIKQLEAKGTLDSFSGDFDVPSYRGSSFMDPKGRGGSTGYDNAIALPAAADTEELAKENNKENNALRGTAVFSVAKVDAETGEIAGVFESIQPSDTDMGAKAAKDIKITGLWYGQLN
eukprot:gene7189-297_t